MKLKNAQHKQLAETCTIKKLNYFGSWYYGGTGINLTQESNNGYMDCSSKKLLGKKILFGNKNIINIIVGNGCFLNRTEASFSVLNLVFPLCLAPNWV